MEALSFAAILESCSFRLVGPGARPADDGHFHVRRDDGSVVTLIQTPGSPLETMILDTDPKLKLRASLILPLLAVRRMSTFTNALLLNAAVQEMKTDRCFVNVGVWNGFTLLSAMAGNEEKVCIGVDNFSEFGGPKAAFLERFTSRRSVNDRFFDQDYVDFFAAGLDRPLGVYLYDGEHSYENQYRGLMVADPFYSEDAIVIVDDTNLDRARDATLQFAEDSRLDWEVIYDQRTATRKHVTLWHGLMILQAGGSGSTKAPKSIKVRDSIEDRLMAEPGNSPVVSVLALGNRELPELEAKGREIIPVANRTGLRDALLETSTGGFALILDESDSPSSTAIARAVSQAQVPTRPD